MSTEKDNIDVSHFLNPVTYFLSDSLVPVLICLLVEKGLAVEIITESLGMFIHVTNIIVLILIPMVIIHVRGHVFSLSKCGELVNQWMIS